VCPPLVSASGVPDCQRHAGLPAACPTDSFVSTGGISDRQQCVRLPVSTSGISDRQRCVCQRRVRSNSVKWETLKLSLNSAISHFILKSRVTRQRTYPTDKSRIILSLKTVRPMWKERKNESDPNPAFKVDLQVPTRPDPGNLGRTSLGSSDLPDRLPTLSKMSDVIS
jgi:hypothetical protein